jgi:hypothetical protein
VKPLLALPVVLRPVAREPLAQRIAHAGPLKLMELLGRDPHGGRTTLLEGSAAVPWCMGHSRAIYNPSDPPIELMNIDFGSLNGKFQRDDAVPILCDRCFENSGSTGEKVKWALDTEEVK